MIESTARNPIVAEEMTTAFHASTSRLNPNAPVPNSSQFFTSMRHDDPRRAAEELLESVRPTNCPRRSDAVYLFEDLQFATRWAAQRTRTLYRASIKAGSPIFRGDWNWLPIITNEIVSNPASAKSNAGKYWSSNATATPVWELLTSSATVLDEVVITFEERTRFRLQAAGLPIPST